MIAWIGPRGIASAVLHSHVDMDIIVASGYGLAERRAYQQRPTRCEYFLTNKGEAFYPVLMALRAWGERWVKAPGEARAMNYVHRDCGQPAGLGPLCQSCSLPLTRANVTSRQSPAYARERADRAERFKTAK